MRDNNKECENILKEFKSCLNEMSHPVLDPKIKNGFGKIMTNFGILDISVYLEIAYNSRRKIAEIKIDSSLSMDKSDSFILLQILNIMNGEMMDIGHICFGPYCEEVFMHTSIDFTKPNFDRSQMLILLKRFIKQGYLCFRILREISQMSKCPFEVLSDHLNTMKYIHKNENETIHSKEI